MRKQYPLSVVFLFVVLISGCSHSEHAGHGDTPKLEVTNPLRKNLSIQKEYVAQIHAIRRIEMLAMERGYIEEIFVDEGQKIQKGQPMFKMVQSHQQAEFDKASAEASALRIEYENTRALAEKNIVSQNELALAQANLNKAIADVTMAQAHLAWTEINAPFDGYVDRLEVRAGSLVEENGLLTTLSDISNMWVYFNLPEAEYLDYVSGKTKQSAVKVHLRMANGAIYSHSGAIETIVADFDNKTGNIEFRANFPNPNSMLRHGQTGNILMSTPYMNAIVIPQKATFEILDKTYVYVVNANSEIEQRLISVAAELPHVYIVKDGLKESDRVLLEGLRKVNKGQKIEAVLRRSEQIIAGLNLYAE